MYPSRERTGTLSGKSTEAIDGNLQTFAFTGTYNLGSDLHGHCKCDNWGRRPTNIQPRSQERRHHCESDKERPRNDHRVKQLRLSAGTCSLATLNGIYQMDSEGMQKAGLLATEMPSNDSADFALDGVGGFPIAQVISLLMAPS